MDICHPKTLLILPQLQPNGNEITIEKLPKNSQPIPPQRMSIKKDLPQNHCKLTTMKMYILCGKNGK
jgi:hypothetical protein